MKKKLQDGTVYFRQKDILRPIGAVLLPLGLVVVYFTYSYIFYILGGLASVGGLVMFIVGGARYVSDNDVAELMDHALLDYDRSVTEMTGYERVVLKQPAPFEISAYDFSDRAKYFKRHNEWGKSVFVGWKPCVTFCVVLCLIFVFCITKDENCVSGFSYLTS